MSEFVTQHGYKVVTDETGLVVSISNPKGKPVKAGFLSAVRKAQETRVMRFQPLAGNQTVAGMHRSEDLDAFEYAVYRATVIFMQYYNRNPFDLPFPVQTFDRLRGLFNEMNHQAYMSLVD